MTKISELIQTLQDVKERFGDLHLMARVGNDFYNDEALVEISSGIDFYTHEDERQDHLEVGQTVAYIHVYDQDNGVILNWDIDEEEE